MGLLAIAAIAGAALYVNSSAFHERARTFIVEQIEKQTGASASLARVDWSVWNQRAILQDLTVRGTEPLTDPPLAHVATIRVGVNLRSLLTRRIDLSELTIGAPEFRLAVDANGKTNLPEPPQRAGTDRFNLELSIDNFKIENGTAQVNEQQVRIDLEMKNLVSDLSYRSATRILSMEVGYDGLFQQDAGPAIPYRFSGMLDYTRGTLAAHRLGIESGKSTVTLQGRIDEAFSQNIKGRLEYSGDLDVPFLNHFFPKESFSGRSGVTGTMDFARGLFSTRGHAKAPSIGFGDWKASNLDADYVYQYPEKQLSLRRMSAAALGGNASGDITVESLPGPSRVSLDLAYEGVDSAALSRVYPWDPKYRIYSRLTGKLQGWFEGKFERFDFGGAAALASYTPPALPGIVALPADGSAEFRAQPGQVEIHNGDIRFFSTSIRAEGLIHPTASNLAVELTSSNLANLFFVYPDANGAGSFTGTLTGPIGRPTFEGTADVTNHRYSKWTIQRAAGGVRLETGANNATLRALQVTLGESQAALDGTVSLDGSAVDLRIQAVQARGRDVAALVERPIDGLLSGDIRVTSLQPIHAAGRVSATGLVVDGRSLGSVQGMLDFKDPAVTIRDLRVDERGATLSGEVSYNRESEEFSFAVKVASIDFDRVRDLGLPETLEGVIQQADLKGSGSRYRPEINGEAIVRDFQFHEEVIPRARLEISTRWPRLLVTLRDVQNLDVSAQVDLSAADYPYDAEAVFRNYNVEKLAGFNQGTVTVTGEAEFTGQLTKATGMQGNGTIRAARAVVNERELETAGPFTFDVNSQGLTFSRLSLGGNAGTRLEVGGTVGFARPAELALTAEGSVDIGLLAAADPAWDAAGVLTFDGSIRGTTKDPNISGSAHFGNASVSREGIFTSLSNLNGDVVFSGTRVTISNMEGSVGSGTVSIQGNGVLQNNALESMNIRIDTNGVRLRYPQGLRTVVDGTLVLRGSTAAPILEGNLQIDSMSYRSEFEEFLALFQSGGLNSSGSPLDPLRLSIHVAGNRNITIKNELADVEARVDLDIKGTVSEPTMTGHVEISGGTLLFQGSRYEITRGNIDFTDPLKIDPVIDLQAETELRDYRVILAISGRGNAPHVDLRSDPPLPELELVGLIAGGRTREELASESGAAPTSEAVFQSGAASILFDLLRSRVGGRFGLLGLDRIRIDPYVLGPGNNPSARITLSEQVTKNLSVTYSQDLASNQQRVILIEYFFSKNLSVVASREENNDTTALGLDIRLRRRF